MSFYKDDEAFIKISILFEDFLMKLKLFQGCETLKKKISGIEAFLKVI
jgi:hypothetical protein